MIDKEILDEVIPVPDLEDLKNEAIGQLEDEGFVVTNFHSGGVFYTIELPLGRRVLHDTHDCPSH